MMSPGNEAHLIARKPEAPGPLEFSGVRNKSLIKTPFQTQLLRETHFKKKKKQKQIANDENSSRKPNHLLWYILLITFFFLLLNLYKNIPT